MNRYLFAIVHVFVIVYDIVYFPLSMIMVFSRDGCNVYLGTNSHNILEFRIPLSLLLLSHLSSYDYIYAALRLSLIQR